MAVEGRTEGRKNAAVVQVVQGEEDLPLLLPSLPPSLPSSTGRIHLKVSRQGEWLIWSINPASQGTERNREG